jgi:hypothetical protein
MSLKSSLDFHHQVKMATLSAIPIADVFEFD